MAIDDQDRAGLGRKGKGKQDMMGCDLAGMNMDMDNQISIFYGNNQRRSFYLSVRHHASFLSIGLMPNKCPWAWG